MANYTFKKSDGGEIPNAQATEWMDRYRAKHPEKETVISRFIGTDIVQRIIDQPEAVGFRVYFGYNAKYELEIFLVGARADGSNIWPESSTGKDNPPGGILGDSTMSCPPYCP